MSHTLIDDVPNWAQRLIEATSFSIERGDLVIACDLNFSIGSGTLSHIKGKNGSGKTTLLLTMAGLLPVTKPSSLLWADCLPQTWPTVFVGIKSACHASLTVSENMLFLADIESADLPDKIEEVIHLLGLAGYEDEPFYALSSGQQRRIQLSRLWLTENSDCLWLLDEPFTALDQGIVKLLQRQLLAHVERGGRVVLSSHQPVDGVTHNINLDDFARQTTLNRGVDVA